MTKPQVETGVLLRVIKDRWDVPAGTLAEVNSVRQERGMEGWCFTVRWHRVPPKKRATHRDHSINLFEQDLADFEVFSGPLPPIPLPQRRGADVIMSGTPSPQLDLPYTTHDYVADRLDLDGLPLAPDPLWHLDLDV
jgi:hypothetical protein